MTTNGNAAENPNFKPALFVICIIAVVIILIGQSCGSDDERSSDSSTTTSTSQRATSSSPAPAVPAPSERPVEELVPGQDYDPNLAFILNLNSGGVPYASQEDAVYTAGQICLALANGTGVRTVQAVAVNEGGYSVANAVYFVEAAVNAYCPQYSSLVN